MDTLSVFVKWWINWREKCSLKMMWRSSRWVFAKISIAREFFFRPSRFSVDWEFTILVNTRTSFVWQPNRMSPSKFSPTTSSLLTKMSNESLGSLFLKLIKCDSMPGNSMTCCSPMTKQSWRVFACSPNWICRRNCAFHTMSCVAGCWASRRTIGQWFITIGDTPLTLPRRCLPC